MMRQAAFAPPFGEIPLGRSSAAFGTALRSTWLRLLRLQVAFEAGPLAATRLRVLPAEWGLYSLLLHLRRRW